MILVTFDANLLSYILNHMYSATGLIVSGVNSPDVDKEMDQPRDYTIEKLPFHYALNGTAIYSFHANLTKPFSYIWNRPI